MVLVLKTSVLKNTEGSNPSFSVSQVTTAAGFSSLSNQITNSTPVAGKFSTSAAARNEIVFALHECKAKVPVFLLRMSAKHENKYFKTLMQSKYLKKQFVKALNEASEKKLVKILQSYELPGKLKPSKFTRGDVAHIFESVDRYRAIWECLYPFRRPAPEDEEDFLEWDLLLWAKEYKSKQKSNNFCFEQFLKHGNLQPQPVDEKFLEWFIGFFEAKGTFLYWQPYFNSHSYGCRLIRTFALQVSHQDIALIRRIKEILGFGYVTIMNRNNCTHRKYARLFITVNEKNLEQLVSLFNGNLLTEKKQKQFQTWVKNMNAYYLLMHTYEAFTFNEPYPQYKINNRYNAFDESLIVADGSYPKHKINNRTLNFHLLENAWFSGFCEGAAGFHVNSKTTRTNKNGSESFNIKMYFSVSGKDTTFVTYVAKNFGFENTNISNKRRDTMLQFSKFTTKRLDIHLSLFKYFKRFPFLGKEGRSIQLKSWSKLLDYRLNDYPVTRQSTEEVIRLMEELRQNGRP